MNIRHTRLTMCLAVFAADLLAGAVPALAWDWVTFDLPSGGKESLWRDALAHHVGGTTEVRVATGRIDVTTSNEVFEVERPTKWKEGMGQVLAYAGDTGKKPVLAIMSYAQGPENLQAKSKKLFDLAEETCIRNGVRLLILFPARPEDFPHTRTNKPTAGAR